MLGSSSTTRALAGLALLLALAGCASDREGSPTQPTPPPIGTDPVAYTALGASDAIGVGATVPCFPFAPCPEGTGYVPVIARRLAEGRQVTLTNLGVPGTVIGPEIQQLGNRHGRGIPGNFLQQQMPFVPRATTLVTVFAGGNDTNAVGAALAAGEGSANPRAFVDSQIEVFRRHYDDLIRGVRERAPQARIVVANLPNMGVLPYASGYSARDRSALQQISVGFSQQVINRLVSQNVAVVDVLCDPRTYDGASYSSDGYHPNDRGYALMAELYLAAITSASPPQPAASCPQASLLPPL
jgi:lysophospholipase L1-like esterase